MCAAGCSTIVLGAWGCGVFRNRQEVVAELWSEVLDALEWRGRFARVVFAVPHGAHGRSLAALPPRRFVRPLAGPLIPFTCLYRCTLSLFGLCPRYAYVAVCSRSAPLTVSRPGLAVLVGYN